MKKENKKAEANNNKNKEMPAKLANRLAQLKKSFQYPCTKHSEENKEF